MFSPGYRLRPLSEVAQFIETHQLPDVPPAAGVAREGVGLTSLSAVLPRQVKELTLRLIEQETNRTLAARLAKLETTL